MGVLYDEDDDDVNMSASEKVQVCGGCESL